MRSDTCGEAVLGADQRGAGAMPLLTLTEAAVEMAKAAMRREGAEGFGLRVGVASGGCSGLQYQMGFEEKPRSGDVVFEQDGVTIFVDSASRPHLEGVTLDYVTGLRGAGFKFINPGAARTCGCGSSFAG